MENYAKLQNSNPPKDERNDICQVNIKGKKIRACISQSLKTLQSNKEKVVIIGCGQTVTKAITTAEIIKRKVKGLHQLNNLYYTKHEDVWEPKEEGLDQLKVTRNIPTISITLSYKPLDDQTPGYQAPGVHQPLVQFRDEDIELADEKLEENNDIKQNKKQKVDKKREHKPQHGEENAKQKQNGSKKNDKKKRPKSAKTHQPNKNT